MTKNMASSQPLKDILYSLEISDSQSEVYLALLELGDANYTELSKKIGIKRTTLYSIIDKMEEKGLIKKSLDKKTFEPVHPQQVFEKLQGNNLIFFHALPQFQSLMKQPEKITKVKFYKGRKGIQQLFIDELAYYKTNQDKVIKILSGAAFYAYNAEQRDQYAIKRQQMGFDTRIIASYDMKDLVKKYKKQFSTQKIKILPENLGNMTGRIAASPSRISLIGFIKDESGIIIESKELADTYIKFFNFTWNLLK